MVRPKEESQPRQFQGECKVCGWLGGLHDNMVAAEEEAAEHAGYCSMSKQEIAKAKEVRQQWRMRQTTEQQERMLSEFDEDGCRL